MSFSLVRPRGAHYPLSLLLPVVTWIPLKVVVTSYKVNSISPCDSKSNVKGGLALEGFVDGLSLWTGLAVDQSSVR